MTTRRHFLRVLLGAPLASLIPLPVVTWLKPRYPALTIAQVTAVSYPIVLFEMRQQSTSWAESIFLRELERQGAHPMYRRVSLDDTAIGSTPLH